VCQPGPEAIEVKQMSTGELLGGIHVLATDGAVVIKLFEILGGGIIISDDRKKKRLSWGLGVLSEKKHQLSFHVGEGFPELQVLEDLLVGGRDRGPDVQDEDQVNDGEGEAVKELWNEKGKENKKKREQEKTEMEKKRTRMST
jgi:hypothetical protein